MKKTRVTITIMFSFVSNDWKLTFLHSQKSCSQKVVLKKVAVESLCLLYRGNAAGLFSSTFYNILNNVK